MLSVWLFTSGFFWSQCIVDLLYLILLLPQLHRKWRRCLLNRPLLPIAMACWQLSCYAPRYAQVDPIYLSNLPWEVDVLSVTCLHVNGGAGTSSSGARNDDCANTMEFTSLTPCHHTVQSHTTNCSQRGQHPFDSQVPRCSTSASQPTSCNRSAHTLRYGEYNILPFGYQRASLRAIT